MPSEAYKEVNPHWSLFEAYLKSIWRLLQADLKSIWNFCEQIHGAYLKSSLEEFKSKFEEYLKYTWSILKAYKTLIGLDIFTSRVVVVVKTNTCHLEIFIITHDQEIIQKVDKST